MPSEAEAFSLDKAVGTAIEKGAELARPQATLIGGDGVSPHYVTLVPGGGHGGPVVGFEPSSWHPPAFKSGSTEVLDVPSFAHHFARHAGAGTMLTGSLSAAKVDAVFDWHSPSAPGRGVHRLTLVCQRTPEWAKLRSMSGKQVSQEAFAEFLDDMRHVFDEPDAARLTETVMALEGAKNVAWGSKVDRVSGGAQLTWTEDVSAQTKGGAVFPSHGSVVCPVFVGGKAEQVGIDFRYRVKDGSLTVGFVMPQVERIERDAFIATCKAVEDAVEHIVLLSP